MHSRRRRRRLRQLFGSGGKSRVCGRQIIFQSAEGESRRALAGCVPAVAFVSTVLHVERFLLKSGTVSRVPIISGVKRIAALICTVFPSISEINIGNKLYTVRQSTFVVGRTGIAGSLIRIHRHSICPYPERLLGSWLLALAREDCYHRNITRRRLALLQLGEIKGNKEGK